MLEGFEIEGLLRFILSKILLFHFKVFFPDKSVLYFISELALLLSIA